MAKWLEKALYVASNLLGILAAVSILVLDIPAVFGLTYEKAGPVSVDANHVTKMTFEVRTVGIRPSLVILQFTLIAVWCFVARWWILKQKANSG